LLPGKGIGLSHRAESKEYQTTHLTMHGDTLLLVIEDLYDDFEKACQLILAKGFPVGDKMASALLSLPGDEMFQIPGLPLPNVKITPY
jgi:hypothetical protein